MQRATSLAAEMEQTLGIKATLLEGHGGIFEVSLNNEIIYSNHRECHQQYVPEDIIRDIGKAVPSNKVPKKDFPRKCEGG